MKTNDDIYQELTIEMFKRVGLNYNYDQIKEYTKEKNWYQTKTWTEKEHDDFKEWGTKYLMKELQWTRRVAEKQIAWLLLDIGWKTK